MCRNIRTLHNLDPPATGVSLLPGEDDRTIIQRSI